MLLSMASLLVQLKPLYNLLIENLIMANEDKNLHEPAEEVSGTQILHGKAPFFLIIIYLVVILWAVLAWIRPYGT
ncbi:hypothetical protein LBMAG01_09000 [Acidobacteriota bacterium]|jgi:hypothetical protein|nr:hypothetical protein LBMAG01_09000 [Acidobacteriota bacterium]